MKRPAREEIWLCPDHYLEREFVGEFYNADAMDAYLTELEAEVKRLVDALDDLMCAIKDDGSDQVRYTTEYDSAFGLLGEMAGIPKAAALEDTHE